MSLLRRMPAAALVLLLAAGAALAQPAPGDGLDGSVWKVRPNTFMAKVLFWRYDHISFKNGEFLSAERKAHGFQPGPYTAVKAGEGVSWTATLQSPDEGKVVWEGKRAADRMTGTWTWMKLDGKTKVVGWTALRI